MLSFYLNRISPTNIIPGSVASGEIKLIILAISIPDNVLGADSKFLNRNLFSILHFMNLSSCYPYNLGA